jgi:molybdopterin-guanine dinucleotide biosynthesis protein B
MKIFGIAGYSGSGKTTLIERVLPQLAARGLKVAVIKHTHHDFDIDRPGKDSWRAREAGAVAVLLASDHRTAVLTEHRDTPPLLDDLLSKLPPCDLVLVEGYKREGHAKLEVRRAGLDHPKLAGDDPTVVAIASDFVIADAPVPVLDMNDVAAVADFIVAHVKLEPRP